LLDVFLPDKPFQRGTPNRRPAQESPCCKKQQIPDEDTKQTSRHGKNEADPPLRYEKPCGDTRQIFAN